jgi:hypothetical protein
VGTLTFQSDSTWTGVVEAKVRFKQAMEAFGVAVCPEADYEGSQRLQLSGTKAGGFNPASQTIIYSTGTADGGFLELTVQPVGPPVMNSMDCLSLYEDAAWSFPLLPLNDARWNQLTSGYVIGLPQSGLVVYTDSTLRAFQTNLNPAQPAGASSSWKIRVDRR